MAQLSYDMALDSNNSPESYDDHDSSFFRKPAPSLPQLPTPAMVQARCGSDNTGRAVFEELGVFVKFGNAHRIRIEEAQTLQAIKRAFPNNEISTPEFFGWRSCGKRNYIYMSFMPGVTLKTSWPTLSAEEKTCIADQLSGVLSLLRNLAQPAGNQYIGSISGTKVQGSYFRSDPDAGPFSTVKDFNDRLMLWSAPWIPLSQWPSDPFREKLPDTATICFSHGDLHLANIMISGDPGSRSVAIIDWADSGWYPEWWEYAMMSLGFKHWDEGWLPSVLKSYPEEALAYGWYWNANPP